MKFPHPLSETLPCDPTPGQVEGHWSLTDNPHLLRVLEHSFRVPADMIDVRGDWHQCYDLIFCGPQDYEPPHWVYQGWMEISRKVLPEGMAQLHAVQQHILGPEPDLEWQRVKTHAVFNADLLGTVPDGETWTVEARTLGQPDPAARPFSRTLERSVLSTENNERIWKRSIGNQISWETRLPADIPIAGSLGLIDALQRHPRGNLKFPKFGMIKQGASWCPAQKIRALPRTALQINGSTIALHGYVQTGRAHLPTFFWFDATNRLVALRYGVLALILTPQPFMKSRCPHAA